MSTDLSFACSCGAVTGVLRGVTPKTVNRVICSCSGCQRYVRALGRGEALLDEHDGTDIIQVSPASFELVTGHDQVACLRQTRKGALRWYTRCCGTPIANTAGAPGFPFMGFLVGTLGDGAGPPSSDVIGPVRARINGSYDPADAKRLRATSGALVPMLFRLSRMLLGWRIRGAHRRWALDWQTPIEREVRITGAVP